MRSSINLFSALCTALCMMFWGGCGRPSATARVGNRFNPEVSHGQVRVVLLRAGPAGSPANQPTFCVTYGVEVPTNGAFSDLSFSSQDEIDLVVGGNKLLDFRGERSSEAMGFEELPRHSELRQPALQDGRAMLFQNVTFTGLPDEAKRIDIRLRLSWRGTPLSFDFEGVPVGFHSAEQGR